jgi:hypothetical protein
MVHQMQERNDLSSQMPMRMDFHEIIFEGFGPFRGEQLIILRRRGLTKITGVWENGFLAHLTALVNRWQRFQHSYGACLDIDSSLEKMIFYLFGKFSFGTCGKTCSGTFAFISVFSSLSSLVDISAKIFV